MNPRQIYPSFREAQLATEEAARMKREAKARRDARILRMLREGEMMQTEIAASVGCSPAVVQRVAKEHGVSKGGPR